jgi:hypothetical protein
MTRQVFYRIAQLAEHKQDSGFGYLGTEPPPGQGNYLGRFEWNPDVDGYLVITALDDSGFMTFKSWGMPPEEVSQTELEAVYLYYSALGLVFKDQENASSYVFEKFCHTTFEQVLAKLKSFAVED